MLKISEHLAKVMEMQAWSQLLWPEGYLIVRPIAVVDSRTSSDRNPVNKDYILTTSSPCLCEPSVIIWLSLDGLEDPKSELIAMEFVNDKRTDNGGFMQVQFDWFDGGKYNGYFAINQQCLDFANNQRTIGKIVDIGSIC